MDMGIPTVDRKYVFAMTYEAKDTVAAARKLRLLLVRHDLLAATVRRGPAAAGPLLRRGMPPNAQGYFRDRHANLRRLGALLADPDRASAYLVGDLWISEPAPHLSVAAPEAADLGAEQPAPRAASLSGRKLAARVSRSSSSSGLDQTDGVRASPGAAAPPSTARGAVRRAASSDGARQAPDPKRTRQHG